jgi:predicted acyltransferase
MESSPPSTRLRSLDALRGFDMLWIIGLDTFFRALAKANDHPALASWAEQLHRVSWDGLRAYDLIFPLFMFLSGVAIPYSLGSKNAEGVGRGSATLAILRRAAILVFLGLIYNGFLDFNFEKLRFASVLGQIGIAWAIAALIWTFTTKTRTRIGLLCGIFLFVAILQLFIPVPGHGAGILTREGVINGWIDRNFLPGRLHGKTFDPEGWLCILSASALTLGGAFAGQRLRSQGQAHLSTVGIFAGLGVLLILLGYACQTMGYPPIKAAWTGTFNLYAGGISLLLLALFHLLIDFTPTFNWSFPLQVVGMNPLTIYLLTRIVAFEPISKFFFGGLARLNGDYKLVILASGTLLLEWLVLYALYRRRLFLRV